MKIVDIDQVGYEELYTLIEKVYASSDFFSEVFSDKYTTLEDLQNDLENHALKLLVVKETELVGYLFVSQKREAHLQHTAYFTMGVAPEKQGQGIGRFLLNQMLLKLPENIEILYLMTRFDNEKAIDLYIHFGFEEICILEKDTKKDGKYYDGVLMRKMIGELDNLI